MNQQYPKKAKKDSVLDIHSGPEDDPNDKSITLFDEIQSYLAVKPVPREINTLIWWKAI